MTGYESMVKTMKPIGAYTLDGTTYVDNELKAYAAELDRLSAEIEEVIKESIVTTAEGDGLRFYERLVGTLDDNTSTDLRREMIIYLLNLNMNDNTPDGIKKFFKSIGLECEITENPAIFDLYIKPLGGEYSISERKYIINRAKDFLPCHLTFTIDFREATWADYDSKGRTFKQIDALGLSWEEFEQTTSA